MWIKSFEIEGLFGSRELIGGTFAQDLGILTGRNGAGKTSVLKLLWSIVSGNIIVGLDEVPFKRVRVVTSEYECTVHRVGPRHCVVDFATESESVRYEDEPGGDDFPGDAAEDMANQRLIAFGRSLFFPTFRRIEGGFTTTPKKSSQAGFLNRQARARGDLEEALQAISRTLTNDPHLFVCAISTSDIVTLLLRQYANLSEESNRRQAEVSREIIQTITTRRRDQTDGERLVNATKTIDEVLARVETMEAERKQIMTPWEEARNLVERLFVHTGIKIGTRMSFGDAAKAVDSDQLSAGEKQMLSFVCYNAFYHDAIIFIDEPELSLHPDWQRQLFGILQRQQSSNQFIVATHSPFMYSKFPDKEVEIASDRGDSFSEPA